MDGWAESGIGARRGAGMSYEGLTPDQLRAMLAVGARLVNAAAFESVVLSDLP